MSLLLDALKKSGVAESKSNDRLNQPPDAAHTTATEPSRVAGETLFAAKKRPSKNIGGRVSFLLP